MARQWTKCPILGCHKNIKNQQIARRIKNLDKHIKQAHPNPTSRIV